MGAWGFYNRPVEPPFQPDWAVRNRIVEMESLELFIEREMSFQDAIDAVAPSC